jgi:hypothetical protein
MWSVVGFPQISHAVMWPVVGFPQISHAVRWPVVGFPQISHAVMWPVVRFPQISHTVMWPVVGFPQIPQSVMWPIVGFPQTPHAVIYIDQQVRDMSLIRLKLGKTGLDWTKETHKPVNTYLSPLVVGNLISSRVPNVSWCAPSVYDSCCPVAWSVILFIFKLLESRI